VKTTQSADGTCVDSTLVSTVDCNEVDSTLDWEVVPIVEVDARVESGVVSTVVSAVVPNVVVGIRVTGTQPACAMV